MDDLTGSILEQRMVVSSLINALIDNKVITKEQITEASNKMREAIMKASNEQREAKTDAGTAEAS